jgi:ketosteroid isomerase-like protein
MSASLDLVRSIYAAWERGDWSAAQWAHPDIEFVIANGPDPGGWKGLAAMAAAMREHLRAWEGYRSEAEEFRELGGDRVMVLYQRHARGKRSGLKIHAKRGDCLRDTRRQGDEDHGLLESRARIRRP